jgi:hypothetical protein
MKILREPECSIRFRLWKLSLRHHHHLLLRSRRHSNHHHRSRHHRSLHHRSLHPSRLRRILLTTSIPVSLYVNESKHTQRAGRRLALSVFIYPHHFPDEAALLPKIYPWNILTHFEWFVII